MLIALGLVTVYQVARVENLAQAGFVVYGGLVLSRCMTTKGYRSWWLRCSACWLAR